MKLDRQKENISALERGIEEALCMTLVEYAILADEHPKRAKKVYKRALKRLERKGT